MTCITTFDGVYDEELVATGGRDGYVHLYHQSERIRLFQTKEKSPVTALEFAGPRHILCGTSSGVFEMFNIGIRHESAIKGKTIFVQNHCPIVAIKVISDFVLVSFSTSVQLFKKTGMNM